MAKLFLSYSRKNAAKAQRLAEWLEREGHDVWRDDDDIGAGESFSSEIEKALKDSDAVLVLWSAESVQSAWVRDEAGFGRDTGKLIPFSLDGTEPPLGFRQFQSINISRWKGQREGPDANRIREAIARVSHSPEAAPAPRPVAGGRWHKDAFRKAPLVAGIAIAAAIVLAVFVWQRGSSGHQIAISV